MSVMFVSEFGTIMLLPAHVRNSSGGLRHASTNKFPTNNVERLKCLVMPAKESDDDLQRLIITLRIASRSISPPVPRGLQGQKEEEKNINPAFACCASTTSHGVRMSRNRSSLAMSMDRCVRVYAWRAPRLGLGLRMEEFFDYAG